MICPHCEKSLLRRERPGNVCGKCGRRYALDPKTNPLRLNDLRVRRITGKLTGEGHLPCTAGQLWYAVSRGSLRDTRVDTGCAIALALFGIVLLLVGLSTVGVFAVVGALLLAGALGFVVAEARGVGRGVPRIAREAFRSGPLADWTSVYGSLPPGVLDDSRYPSPPTEPSDGLVLVCPDPSIAVFLDAAGLTTRYGLVLAADPGAIPATGPVLVLHDADAGGLLLARRVRGAWPGRPVVDIGLPLAAVYGRPRAVPVRGRPPEASVMAALEESGEYGPEQLRWLRKGWGFPLVGVEPTRLLAVVSRAVERAGAAADPERRRAASVGFLTWPEGGGP
ncbi:hypothetical protein [Streptomyces sp. B93]|uniref:hypothetical protein n=1 Tax=Streptomyces sp. B93 TaxID=2824875 RepID=UPI001B392E7E|nr:hypothetical protein [Streptomyces sp. B93]MBQ1091918.1 hypothetical protein [Streptomyces sp. B93]